MPSATHIVPLLVGCPVVAKRIATYCSPNTAFTFADQLSDRPARAPSGCASPRPRHDEAMMDELTSALVEILGRDEIRLAA